MSVVDSFTEQNPLMPLLGIVVLAASLVTFGLVELEVLNNLINPYVGWIFIGSFVLIYFLSERSVGDLEDWELLALILPLVAVASFKVVPEFQTIVNDYSPYSGLALFGLTIGGYYVLATEMELGSVVVQLLLGGILVFTAGIEYGLIDASVMGSQITEISVWVFLITLAGAYMISEYSMGMMDTQEIVAFGAGVGAFVAYKYVPEFANVVDQYDPYGAIALTGLVIVSFWFIMNDGELM